MKPKLTTRFIARGVIIMRSQPKIFRSKKDRRAARRLMKDEEHFQIMNKARIDQSLPKEYLEALVKATK